MLYFSPKLPNEPDKYHVSEFNCLFVKHSLVYRCALSCFIRHHLCSPLCKLHLKIGWPFQAIGWMQRNLLFILSVYLLHSTISVLIVRHIVYLLTQDWVCFRNYILTGFFFTSQLDVFITRKSALTYFRCLVHYKLYSFSQEALFVCMLGVACCNLVFLHLLAGHLWVKEPHEQNGMFNSFGKS